MGTSQLPRPFEKLAGHLLGDGLSIRDMLGQHVPHHKEHLARDRDDRFRLAQSDRQPFEQLLPVGVAANRDPGGFNHGRAEVTPPLFGNSTATVLLTRAVDPGAQPGVANQFVRGVKPPDVADRRQQHHRVVHPDTWQLHQKRGLLSPRLEAAGQCNISFESGLGACSTPGRAGCVFR
jgi:hypothetical protein